MSVRGAWLGVAAVGLGLVLAPAPALADHPCDSEQDEPTLGVNPGQGDDEIGVHACQELGTVDPDPDTPPSRYILGTQGDPECWQVQAIGPGHDRYDSAMASYEEAQAAGEFIYDELLPWVDAFAEALATSTNGVIDIDLNVADLILPCDAVSPDIQAYLAWRDQITLPPPDGDLDPGTDVITGMDTYLAVGDYQPGWDTDADPRTVTWTGPIRIVATAEHQVDWGDGTVTPAGGGWYASNGREWAQHPPADAAEPIVHVYQDATEDTSPYRIDVTTRWTARWETLDGSQGGVVPFFRYSDDGVDLDVDQVQAVVTEQH